MYKIGDKIKFKEEKQKYTIQACDKRYLICTKPFNLKRTYLYTIVDLVSRIRGRCNYIFGPPNDYRTVEGAKIALQELNSGEMEISHRNFIDLNLD